MFRFFFVFCLALLLSGISQVQAQTVAEHRVALVIGNADYPDAPLPRAIADARAVAARLQETGFEVIVVENAGREAFKEALENFRRKLGKGDVALVFYSGHAVQVADHNFLVPVGATLKSIDDLDTETIDLTAVLDKLILAQSLGGVILDASHRNPWQARLFPNVEGLAPLDPLFDVTVASAAEPGKASLDQTGGDSYGAQIARALAEPDQRLDAILRHAGDETARLSGRRQIPWLSLAVSPAPMIITHRTADVHNSGVPPQTPPTQPADRDMIDLAFWESIKASSNPGELRAYLKLFPAGKFADLVRERLKGAAALADKPIVASVPGSIPVSISSTRDCQDCPELALIRSGAFEMGSDRFSDQERPVHRVLIAKDFQLGRREVTFAEWDACVDGGGCNSFKPIDKGLERGNRPVVGINWNDAQAYLAWLSKKTGKTYRLPTESEWEYAARGGTTTAYSWGTSVEKDRANCLGCTTQPHKDTIPTASLPANTFGLFDMAGNAAEWVQDCWLPSYRGAPGDGSALEMAGCRERVVRGGSFSSEAFAVRPAARAKSDPNIRVFTTGFRVAREF